MLGLRHALLGLTALISGFWTGTVISAANYAATTATPSTSTAGGAGVLKPFADQTGVLFSKVDDGGAQGAMPYLSFNNKDSAEAQDRMMITAEIEKYSGGLQVERRVVCKFRAQAEVAIRFAPGDIRQGSYSTKAAAHCGCWLHNSGSAPEDSVSRTVTAAPSILSNASGRLLEAAELVFAQDPTASPLQPLVVPGKDDGSQKEAVTLEYWMTNNATLSARRPEVEVGARAYRTATVTGTLAGWDVTTPANPVILKKADGTDAIWNLN